MARPVAVPLTISLLLHGAILLLLAFNLHFASEPKVLPPQPNVIEAKLVKLDAIPAAKAAPAPKPVEVPPKPIPEPTPPEPKKPEPSKPEPVKPTPVKPPPPKPEPPKPDLEKQKQVEKQKLLEKEQADAAKKAEQQKQQEVERKKQQEELARKQREQAEKAELAKAMAAEEQTMTAANDQESVTTFGEKIRRDIQYNWNRPPSARLGMQVTLSIDIFPTGEVRSVSIAKSSGDAAFDQAAINAVKKVGQFAYLKDIPGRLFDKNFRPLILNFKPEDLRQ